MQKTATTPGLLSADEFNQYTADWRQLVSAPDSPALPASFEAEAGSRALFVSFPIKRVVELVSAVGVRQLKARFVLLPVGGQKKFSLVLFAADETPSPEGRKSAYYLAEPWWAPAAPPALGEALPDNLAAGWLQNWQDEPTVTAALFATPDGPLEGYNFNVKDFLKPLFTDQPYGPQEIRLWLGLHAYYAPTNAGAPTRTFGLVVRRFDPVPQVGRRSSEMYYDLSTPCPPTH